MSTVIGDVRQGSMGSWRDSMQQLQSWVWKSAFIGAMALSEMSFLDHLEELRRRLIKSLIAVVVCSAVCLVYAVKLISFLKKPAIIAGLDITSYESLEIFSLYFTVPLAAGICLAAPFILWQVWRFIEPALYTHEKKYAVPFLLLTTICFVLGAIFGYAIVTPWILTLGHALGDAVGIKLAPSASSYISTLTWTVVAMGAIFEMPPVVFILSRIGLVSAGFLVRNFKYAFLVFTLAAGILTPSTTMAPMIGFMGVMTGLYVVSVVVAFVFGRRRVTVGE
jgi:sec-independent protein translocase protein TatC